MADSKLEAIGYHIRRLTEEGANLSASLRFLPETESATVVVTPLASLPEAEAAIARLTAERDEALELIATYAVRLSRAMEVVRLAEDEMTKLYAAIAPHSDGRAAAGSEAVRAAREFLEGDE